MKLSLDWLSEFVTFTEKDPQKIADALTCSVAEVEEVEVQGELLTNCCVGKVLTVEKHPNADKLSLCDVETDKGKKRVVCGGTNLHEGMLVAFAHVGAEVLWHGGEKMKLEKTKIRGETSEGMICAAEELGLSSMFPESVERIIIDLTALSSQLTARQSLKEALQLSDTILHIDNHAITHRADLFSHVGFARELVAIGVAKWKKRPEYRMPKFPDTKLPFRCKNDIKKLVPRYLACSLSIDALGETPDWMVRRLAAVGVRSLNLPVDITNYVTAEIGMPLHSFDAGDIKGDVHFRTAKRGEKIITLDKEERALPEGAIVLSDDEGIFDLMGIMGGLRSSTKEGSNTLYLHSAVVSPVSIRNTIIEAGLRTDAATVYEKGIPRVTAEQGFIRALELIVELVPGAKITSSLESYGENGEPKPIELSLEHVSRYLGRELSLKEVTSSLEPLGFDIQKTRKPENQKTVQVTPPLHRLGDIAEPVDLIEEIARVTGFASYEPEMPTASTIPPARDHRLNRLRGTLKEAGFMETVQYSFLGKELIEKAAMSVGARRALPLQEVENPLGEDLKYMRPSLMPRLFAYAAENMRLTDGALRLFEVGHIFAEEEHESLGLLVAMNQSDNAKQNPLLVLKAALTEAFGAIDIPFEVECDKKPPTAHHPARAARITVNGKEIGSMAELHPSVMAAFGLPARAAGCELNVDALLKQVSPDRVYKTIPAFPSITYDSTVEVDQKAVVGDVLNKVKGSHELLQSVQLIDLFERGGRRSLTFRCTYGATDRTLTEEEVKPVHKTIEAMLR